MLASALSAQPVAAPAREHRKVLHMGGLVHTGSVLTAHDLACQKAESTRQSSVAGAASSAAGQVVMNNAEIAYARAVVASCIANNGGAGAEAFQSLLRALGTGGV
jgi:hypothetical protein